jgi:hypothetical protein
MSEYDNEMGLEEEYGGEYDDDSRHFQAYDYDDGEDDGEEEEYSNTNNRRGDTRRPFHQKKSTDPAFFTVKRKIQGETVSISYYRTGFTPGTIIRDAITGIADPSFRVGKRDELLYYKVCMATGEGDRGKYGEVEPHHLYYDSPERYERHFCTTVDDNVKAAWAQRAREEQASRNRDAEERSARVNVVIR